jgi:proteasome lid subunit RPN8/RPN11
VPPVLPDSVELPTHVLAQLLAKARSAAPREFVGLLAGHGGDAVNRRLVVRALHELRNVAADDDAYEVPAAAFAAAEARARGDGHTFLGFVHSHPRGPARPSAHDRASWWQHCVQLIVDGEAPAAGASALRAYWLDAATLHELPLLVQPADVPQPFAGAGTR